MAMFISENEIEKIEKIELEKDLTDKCEQKNKNIFFKVQLKKALKTIQNSLKDGEKIQNYFVGRNYSVDEKRLGFAASLKCSYLAHPIFGWNTICVLIRTNSKFILLEMTMEGSYSKHYEISNDIHTVKNKNESYIIVSGDQKKTIIQFNNYLYDIVMDYIKGKAQITIDKKINSKFLKIGKGIGNTILLYIIILTIIFIILEMK